MLGDMPYTYIQDASAEDFDNLVLINSSKGPVLVNYWSHKVGPCIRQYPILAKLADDFAGRFLLVNVDADRYRSLAKDYGVNSLPTLKLFHKGTVVETLHGYQNEAEIQQMIARHIPRDSDETLLTAVHLYQDGERDKGLAMLAEATIDDPQNIRLPMTLARLLVNEQRADEAMHLLTNMPQQQRDDSEVKILREQIGFILTVGDDPAPEQWRSNIESTPDDCESRYRLAALSALNDQYPEAMAGFYEILRIDAEYQSGAARQALITLFTILGQEHELVREYRDKLRNIGV